MPFGLTTGRVRLTRQSPSLSESFSVRQTAFRAGARLCLLAIWPRRVFRPADESCELRTTFRVFGAGPAGGKTFLDQEGGEVYATRYYRRDVDRTQSPKLIPRASLEGAESQVVPSLLDVTAG